MKGILIACLVFIGLACNKKEKIKRDPAKVTEEVPKASHHEEAPAAEGAEGHEEAASTPPGIVASNVECKEGSSTFVLYEENGKHLVYCHKGAWTALPKGVEIASRETEADHDNMVADSEKAPVAEPATFYCRKSKTVKNSFVCKLPKSH